MDPMQFDQQLRMLGLEAERLTRFRDEVQALLDEIRASVPRFLPPARGMLWRSAASGRYAEAAEELELLVGGVIHALQLALGQTAIDLGGNARELDRVRSEREAAGR
ncbi:hypothetical protein [Agromyces archimandritae]|uniref:Uncharacterized protein n=1 Tax=Agromyces archimandritae TaxID=2781962 RepID=A0A975FIX0_9MICO|nr:hypothetical protein [Agromyces archimandritae]QTX03315.1 hypothetical protein G127AT_07910 [Agromyces archimandritae]